MSFHRNKWHRERAKSRREVGRCPRCPLSLTINPNTGRYFATCQRCRLRRIQFYQQKAAS